MKRFITSDWHLGETRFKLFQRRFESPEKMIDYLIECHNSLVGKDDLVYIVGDVVDDQHKQKLCTVQCFNGHKILIRGNHDRVFTDEELLPYFEQIVAEGDGLELDLPDLPCWITHYPTCGKKDRFNLVGHVHGTWRVQLNMLNVGVDAHSYHPLNLDEDVPFLYNAICKYYDEDIWVGYSDLNTEHRKTRGAKTRYFQG